MMPFTDEQIQEEIAKQLKKIGVSDQIITANISEICQEIKCFWNTYKQIVCPNDLVKVVEETTTIRILRKIKKIIKNSKNSRYEIALDVMGNVIGEMFTDMYLIRKSVQQEIQKVQINATRYAEIAKYYDLVIGQQTIKILIQGNEEVLSRQKMTRYIKTNILSYSDVFSEYPLDSGTYVYQEESTRPTIISKKKRYYFDVVCCIVRGEENGVHISRIIDGVLMRKWNPPVDPQDETEDPASRIPDPKKTIQIEVCGKREDITIDPDDEEAWIVDAPVIVSDILNDLNDTDDITNIGGAYAPCLIRCCFQHMMIYQDVYRANTQNNNWVNVQALRTNCGGTHPEIQNIRNNILEYLQRQIQRLLNLRPLQEAQRGDMRYATELLYLITICWMRQQGGFHAVGTI